MHIRYQLKETFLQRQKLKTKSNFILSFWINSCLNFIHYLTAILEYMFKPLISTTEYG